MYKDSPSARFTAVHCKKPNEGLVCGNVDGYTQNYTPNTGKYDFGTLRFQEYKRGESQRGMTIKDLKYSQRLALQGILNKQFEVGWLDVIWFNAEEMIDATEFQINGLDRTQQDMIDYFNTQRQSQIRLLKR